MINVNRIAKLTMNLGVLRLLPFVTLLIYPESLPAQTPTVTIANLTRGGSSQFLVGDWWSVAINGAPNQQVVGSAFHNGVSTGSQVFGSTNASGQFSINGTMPFSAVGNWVEDWYVGGVHATPTLQFDVFEGCYGIFLSIPPVINSTDHFSQADGSYLLTWPYGSGVSRGTVANPPHCAFVYSTFSPLSSPNYIETQQAYAQPLDWLWLASDSGPYFPGLDPRCFQCFYPIVQFGNFEYVAVDLALNVYFFYAPISLYIDRSIEP